MDLELKLKLSDGSSFVGCGESRSLLVVVAIRFLFNHVNVDRRGTGDPLKSKRRKETVGGRGNKMMMIFFSHKK